MIFDTARSTPAFIRKTYSTTYSIDGGAAKNITTSDLGVDSDVSTLYSNGYNILSIGKIYTGNGNVVIRSFSDRWDNDTNIIILRSLAASGTTLNNITLTVNVIWTNAKIATE